MTAFATARASSSQHWPTMYGARLLSTSSMKLTDTTFLVEGDFDLERAVLLVLRNSGKHLFGSGHEQVNTKFLRYGSYCGNGAYVGSVRVQHLGHLYGLCGGSAQVILNTGRFKWKLRCEPKVTYYVVRHNGDEYLFCR